MRTSYLEAPLAAFQGSHGAPDRLDCHRHFRPRACRWQKAKRRRRPNRAERREFIRAVLGRFVELRGAGDEPCGGTDSGTTRLWDCRTREISRSKILPQLCFLMGNHIFSRADQDKLNYVAKMTRGSRNVPIAFQFLNSVI